MYKKYTNLCMQKYTKIFVFELYTFCVLYVHKFVYELCIQSVILQALLCWCVLQCVPFVHNFRESVGATGSIHEFVSGNCSLDVELRGDSVVYICRRGGLAIVRATRRRARCNATSQNRVPAGIRWRKSQLFPPYSRMSVRGQMALFSSDQLLLILLWMTWIGNF